MTHGGKRSGAGRKADPNSKIAYTTKLSPQVVAYLRQCDNAAVLIETLIKRTKAFKELEKIEKVKRKMMTTIKLAFGVSKQAERKIEGLVDQLVLRDKNWQGGLIEIVRSENTGVECDNKKIGDELLAKVLQLIQQNS